MAKSVRVSLANKCQLLFGAAVVFILAAALAVIWVRMDELVHHEQRETARVLANAWLADMAQLGEALMTTDELQRQDGPYPELTLTLLQTDEFDVAAGKDPFIAQALERFTHLPEEREHTQAVYLFRGQPYFRYARAIRKSDLAKLGKGAGAGFRPVVDAPLLADPLQMVLLIQMRSEQARRRLLINRVYIVAAGLLAGLLAIGVFYYITKRIILSPVRVLRETAEQVSAGDLDIRADINTGDEFEQLSTVFNHMLENLKGNEDQLRSINKSLDLKLGELAQTNVALYEANKIKGDFLANVSHELRTPLNSIVGFAELLQDSLKAETEPAADKRRRYAGNILHSSRLLLELITDLLDLAKIEAGRMDLRVAPMSIADTLEGLLNLIRPQADKKQVKLELRVAREIPLVRTDASKFQQIIFNLLSNAVKFTPDAGAVTLAARMMPAAGAAVPRVRITVTDTGPGIAAADHKRIFDKFTQLDPSHTREHAGTGLGLTISRELAHLLQGEIELESELGHGASFSLIIPVTLEQRSVALMPDLTGGGGAAGGGDSSANTSPSV